MTTPTMPLNPLSPTDTVTANSTPDIFLPYQKSWAADESPVKVFVKSRRIGGSWGEAGISALEASRNKGQDTWYIGYTKDMAIEFIRDVAYWAGLYQLACGEIEETEEVFIEGDEKKSVLAYTIKFASGYRVTALSSAPRNLRGKQGRVIIDEAAFHDNLDELLKAAFALLIWGGCVRVISTHNGVDNPFNQLVEDIKGGRKPYSLHECTFDEALEQGLYQRICLVRGIEWTAEGEQAWADEIIKTYADNADEELYCIPKKSGGKWLNRALIESRMSADTAYVVYKRDDDFNLKSDQYREQDCESWCQDNLDLLLAGLPENAKCVIGGDYGRNGDLTDYVVAVREPNLVVRVAFVVELENIPFSQQEQVLNHLGEHVPMLMGMALDARGIGAANAEKALQKFGSHVVEEVKFTTAWYALNMQPFKADLEDAMFDGLPKHENVLSDMQAFEIIDNVPRLPAKKNKGADEQPRHGDMGIACVLAHYASRHLDNGVMVIGSRPREQDTSVNTGIGLISRFANIIRGYD